MDSEIMNAELPILLLEERKSVLSPLATITSVSDDSVARTASRYIDAAKSFVKNVHDERMKITRKIDAIKKGVMSREGEWTDPVNKEIARVSSAVTSYLERVKAEQEAARIAAEEANARACEEAALNGNEVVQQTVVPDVANKPVAGVTSRTYWGIRIVDANAVPRAYCKPDETAIRQYMESARKNGAQVSDLHLDGVEFYTEIRV